jgi:hypothetical protein
MVGLILCLACSLPTPTASYPEEIDSIIHELGNREYRYRVAASRALENLGKQILSDGNVEQCIQYMTTLGAAAANSADPEIRYRAQRLIDGLQPRVTEKMAKKIRDSRLTQSEKGRKLRVFLKVGMSREQVWRLLGVPGGTFESVTTCVDMYGPYAISIRYDRERRCVAQIMGAEN